MKPGVEWLSVVTFDNYRKDELIEACKSMQASLRYAISTGDESAIVAANLYTKADVEAICAMVLAGKTVAEAVAGKMFLKQEDAP